MNAWIVSGAVTVALVAGFIGGRVSDQSECRPSKSDVAANYKAGQEFGYAMAAAADAERRAALAPPPALLPAPPPAPVERATSSEPALAVDPAPWAEQYPQSGPVETPPETPSEAAERIYRESD